MAKCCNAFFIYSRCKCCLMEAMLKDEDLQTKYSERKCSDYCWQHKEKVTGCDFNSCCTCCLLWFPCCHPCGTLKAEKEAGLLVKYSEHRCFLDTVVPCLCCGACIYAFSTKGKETKNRDEMDGFTPIAAPGAFVM